MGTSARPPVLPWRVERRENPPPNEPGRPIGVGVFAKIPGKPSRSGRPGACNPEAVCNLHWLLLSYCSPIGSQDASSSCLCQMKSVRPGVDDSPVLHTPARDPASHLTAPESDCDPGNEASGAEDQITFAHPEPGCVGLTNSKFCGELGKHMFTGIFVA
ncbi:hypothetical protein IRJ41_019063 [Triplophysa rosa]|uniref:Uncharacterized protein n=1 Tax=Triplophysa rosa TaxID=992332 RepID=A0A9W7WBF4_TRIRA|nr:hypothetical protein IRJ41_019063 [Triplophysa rosa]